MIGAILKVTNGSLQKSMIFCRSIYAKKVLELLAFIFEQPSYTVIYLISVYYRNLPWGCLRLVIVVFPDLTHLLFLTCFNR